MPFGPAQGKAVSSTDREKLFSLKVDYVIDQAKKGLLPPDKLQKAVAFSLEQLRALAANRQVEELE